MADSELHSYLQSQSTKDVDSEGSFTLHPEALREKMLASLPPADGKAAYHMLSHLRSALRLSGLEPPPGGSEQRISWLANSYFPVVFEGRWDERGGLTPELVEENVARPFQREDPVSLCLSRALLWGQGLELQSRWEWRTPEGGTLLVVMPDGSVRRSSSTISSRPRLKVWFTFRRRWADHLGPFGRDSRYSEVMRGWGRESPLELEEKRSFFSGPSPRSLRDLTTPRHLFEQGWFQYRAACVVLAEKLVPATQGLAHPLRTSPPARSLRRRALNLLDPLQLPCLWRSVPEGTSEFQLALAFRLSDRPAKVFLSSWGPSVPIVVPNSLKLPPGLMAVGVWPSLSTDVWGERAVEDDHLREALEWLRAEVSIFQSEVAEKLDSLLAELSAHVRSDWREELEEKVRSLWGSGAVT